MIDTLSGLEPENLLSVLYSALAGAVIAGVVSGVAAVWLFGALYGGER